MMKDKQTRHIHEKKIDFFRIQTSDSVKQEIEHVEAVEDDFESVAGTIKKGNPKVDQISDHSDSPQAQFFEDSFSSVESDL